jgi:hypothetical protein
MRGAPAKRILLLAMAAASLGWGQPPTISSLQSSISPGIPYDVTAITSGTPLEGGFYLFINSTNGDLGVGNFQDVTWLDTSTNTPTLLGLVPRVSTNFQLVVNIPQALFATLVSGPVAVSIVVHSGGNTSNTATFTINPPLQSISPSLPSGTINRPYNANLTTGGTPPFSLASAGGTLPSGISVQVPSATLTGTPTQTGLFPLTPSATDFWGNSVSAYANLEIVDVPTLTSPVLPNTSGTGAGGLTITVNGTNFVNAAAGGIPGSYVQWSVGNLLTSLSTTYVSPTQLLAFVPSALLAAPATALITVVQPSLVSSNALPFRVLAPVISSSLPLSVPAGSGATLLTVSGANFVFIGEPFATSTILLNGIVLPTTFVNSSTLTAVVPVGLLISPTQYSVAVANPSGPLSNAATFSVFAPSIASLKPSSAGAGSATLSLAVIGANFLVGSGVSFDGTALATTYVSSTLLNATVPATLMAGPKVAKIVVTNPGGSVSPAASFTVFGTLAITSISLPPGITGNGYSYTLTGTGGTPPYTWSASGLPASLSVNPASGVISGTIQASGTFGVTVGLRDAANATATAQYQLTAGTPPVTVSANSILPSGVVGVAYTGIVYADGGNGSYTFSIGSGRLPDGLSLAPGGAVYGTPKTPGLFPFSAVATDSTGASGSRDFSITIQAAPLSITGGPTGPVAAGTAIRITFAGTGGAPPYSFSTSGALPPGTTFSNGTLSGTPTTAGSFTFRVTVADSTGAVAAKDVTLTVTLAPLSLSGSLGNGKVGVPYSGQISATGGISPYSYAGSGLPDGLSLSASGSISGTPGTAGQFSITATVTDSKGATASGAFPITIAPADLAIVTASLPDGVVGVAYTASLSASGGAPPYVWTVTGLPDGLTATAAGAIGGTPKTAGKFTVNVVVTDATGASTGSRRVSYSVTIAPPPLVITTASAPNGTVGTAYTASFAATGGTAPLTFSASGLPAGLSMSAAGIISGTPTAGGPATMVVTVKDAGGASTSKSFPVTIGLPPAPPLSLTFAGVSGTVPPLTQPRLQVSLGSPYPVDVVVTLTLIFTPDSGGDDPTIQFSSGGRTARITVPAGATSGATDVGVQTGSVAGVITVTSQMQAAGQDVTPSPAPRQTIRIAAAAPVIVPGTITAVRNSTGFTVTLTGYATDRELTQALFQFTAASGSTLQTTTLTVPLDALFAQYFSGSSAVPFGSQFTYTQPFTVTGSTQAIVSVTVTLVNKIGQSSPATATLN